MQPRPSVIVFDVNETLPGMTPMARRFAEVGASQLLAQVWFASLLRDGFALDAAGRSSPDLIAPSPVLGRRPG
jgi:2-haloacid dehalogenase